VISFRQHVVTIVAIFLALALGLLAGSAFIQPRLVDTLQSTVDELRVETDDLRGQVTDLRGQVAGQEGFADAALPHLAEGLLTGQDVVVVAQEGVEDTVVARTRQALNQAGATAVVLEARSSLAPEDADSQLALAELLGLPGADPTRLAGDAAQALADRLATGSDRAAPAETDLLGALLNEGYLAPLGSGVSDASLAAIGGPGQAVVVLSGGQAEDPSMSPEEFAVPLTERLSELGMPVAAGESEGTRWPFVELLRAGSLEGLVTVDNLDGSMGGAALVLALQNRLTNGDGGDFGVRDGAAPLPSLP
jgi:BMFP domain-containing protein YqiC